MIKDINPSLAEHLELEKLPEKAEFPEWLQKEIKNIKSFEQLESTKLKLESLIRENKLS